MWFFWENEVEVLLVFFLSAAANHVSRWQKIMIKICYFDVQGMVHGFVERYGESVLFFQCSSKLAWAVYFMGMGLQTHFKWHSKHFPIGQMCWKLLIQKVKLESNLNLNGTSQKMPFWLVKFWLMKFIFLERGDQMWLVGKNPTKIGQMVWEIWPLEVQEFLKSIRS